MASLLSIPELQLPRLSRQASAGGIITDAKNGADVDWGLDEQYENEAARLAQDWAITRNTMRAGRGAYFTPKLPSEFVEYRFCYDLRKPVQLHLRPWQRAIYDAEYTSKRIRSLGGSYADVIRYCRQTIILAGRQTEKSTGLGNKLLSYVLQIPNITALYVTSAGLNMQEFADERIENVIRISPALKPWTGSFVSYNRYFKRLRKNNSRLVMRSAHLNADRVRGIPADVLAVDEIQNFMMANIPVITATLNNSDLEFGPITLLSGTPLTFDNPIEQIFSKNSTKNLWLMRCSGCRAHNFPPRTMTEVRMMIGPRGLVCKKCAKALDVFSGEWVRTGSKDVAYEGFHLSRALMPYTAVGNPDRFREKWGKFARDVNDPNVDDATKMNEIFGVSWDSGKKPITQDELIRCCHPGIRYMSRKAPSRVINDPTWPIFAGIDWGEGSGAGAYTVITLGYMNEVPGEGLVFQIFYMHRYMGFEAEPEYLTDDIAELLELNKVELAIVDAGMGWGMIENVRSSITDGLVRVIPMRYNNQSAIIGYDELAHQLTCSRTRWMAKVFNQLKNRRVMFPAWDIMDGTPSTTTGFSQDILTIFADRSPKLKQMQFNHTEPDDAFHTVVYALTAKMWWYQELEEFAAA